MPRDIVAIVESNFNGEWNLVLPIVENKHFNKIDSTENQLSETMYINEYYPESIYADYNLELWELFDVKGRFSSSLRGIPEDCCVEIQEYYKSFGTEAFDAHWVSCSEFLSNLEKDGKSIKDAKELSEKIRRLGNPNDMRIIIWFSQ